MREASRTTRERMADRLREGALTPSELGEAFDVRPAAAIRHVDHIAQSLDPTDEQVLAAPPTCRDCGFEDFDDLLNRPSRCPECKSEAVDDPVFRIE